MITAIARPLPRLALVQAALLATLAVGCSAETEGSDPSGAPDPLASVDGDEPMDKAGCSYVQYCNVPNHFLGTVCVQTGCSYCQAVSECERETQIVCGGPTETWAFKYLGGSGAWDSMWWALDICN